MDRKGRKTFTATDAKGAKEKQAGFLAAFYSVSRSFASRFFSLPFFVFFTPYISCTVLLFFSSFFFSCIFACFAPFCGERYPQSPEAAACAIEAVSASGQGGNSLTRTQRMKKGR